MMNIQTIVDESSNIQSGPAVPPSSHRPRAACQARSTRCSSARCLASLSATIWSIANFKPAPCFRSMRYTQALMPSSSSSLLAVLPELGRLSLFASFCRSP
jgi:hypothetical protein